MQLQQRNTLLTALAVIIVLLSLNLAPIYAQETLVVVNGDSITTDDFDNVFASVHGTMSNEKKMNFDYHKLIDRLVNDRLIIQEATAIGIAEEPDFKDFMAREREKDIVRRFVQKHYKFDREVTDADIHDYFEKNYFKVRVRTIALGTRAEADSMRALIAAGTPMDSLAKTRSVDVFRYQGGAHSLMYYAEIENVLRQFLTDAHEGDLIGPFPYQQASMVMRVEKVIPPDESELPSLTGFIRGVLLDDLRKADWEEFGDSLIQLLGSDSRDDMIDAIVSGTSNILDSTFMHGSSEVVATLGNSDQLTEKQLRLETAKLAMNAANAPVDSLVHAALDQWFLQRALALSGERDGLENDPKVMKTLAKTRDSALVEVYLKETVVPQITFNRAEFTRYYDEHKEDFREPGKLFLRRMIIDDEAKADSADKMLKDGGDFDYVMDRFITENRSLVEKSEWVSLNAFPEEIRDELRAIPVGGSSRPFGTPDGWIIFRVLERKEGRLKEPEEVEMAIRNVMFQKQFNGLLDKALALLKDNSEITYNNEAIDRYIGGDK